MRERAARFAESDELRDGTSAQLIPSITTDRFTRTELPRCG